MPTGPYVHEGIMTALDFDDQLRQVLVEANGNGASGVSCEGSSYYTLGGTRIRRLGGAALGLDDLEVGQRVSVEYDGIQLDSCPPIRHADAIFVH